MVDTSLSILDPSLLSKVNTWEEYLSIFIQLNDITTTSSWLKSDLLLKLSQQFGESSLAEFAKQLKIPVSTVTNYVRVARAFPIEKRSTEASFTVHFVASFADEMKSTGEFVGDKRTEFLEKAVVEQYSSRRLEEEIQKEKKLIKTGVDILPCVHCKGTTGEIKHYIFFSPRSKERGVTFELHPECFQDIVKIIGGKEDGTIA